MPVGMEAHSAQDWWWARVIGIHSGGQISEAPLDDSLVPRSDSENNGNITHSVSNSNAMVTAPSQRTSQLHLYMENEDVVITGYRDGPVEGTNSEESTNQARHSTTVQPMIDVRPMTGDQVANNIGRGEFSFPIPHPPQHHTVAGGPDRQAQPPLPLPPLPSLRHHATTSNMPEGAPTSNILDFIENRFRQRPRLFVADDEWKDLVFDFGRPPILIFDPDIWQPDDPYNFHPPGLTQGVLWIRIHGLHTAIVPPHGQLTIRSSFPWWYLLWAEQYIAAKRAELRARMGIEENDSAEHMSEIEDYDIYENADEDDDEHPDPANYPVCRKLPHSRHPCDRWWPLS
ncbi:hypothetical protein K449DRAFT_257243 [Hypoxylon sp. EC38]|nr:hypothetical protein K449DRAFT_257243 [Hypoxylon sp. EC38]